MDTHVSRVAIDHPYPTLPPPQGSSGHYRFLGLLGRGGMAEVHEVEDLRNGRRVAMKRLFPQDDADKQTKARRLFEREYQTLSQLSHPRIVEVYDYAIDDTGPYYTMELLSGGDLSQLVPMDYRRACGLARDVCSALSLLHSRSMVHRDLSPRNVRCTSDGLAKLIDFGAMAPVGRSRIGIVGTPAYSAPEVINGQILDARTDLYALGATLYYALTGHHAYPARDFASLPERWQLACPSPSEYVPELPEALDTLVMELLRLDPLARPRSAFEVIERLCAIDGVAFDEQLVVARAYLATPTLVGRGPALAAVQRKLHRAEKGRGRAVVVSGPPGVGRSRFLDAAALEAKLRGVTVVAADSDDRRDGDYGVVRAIARGLIGVAKARVVEAAGESAAVLCRAIPELAGVGDGAAMDATQPVPRSAMQQALREWFVRISQQGPLVLVVDDFHAIDEPSAAALALLAHDVRQERLLLIASMDSSATPTAPAAAKLLVEAADAVNLTALAKEDSDELLRSIFGDGPDIGLLAHRLHGVAGGNPRDTMELAEHLIDQRTIRYERGAWSVPGTFDARDLPDTMALALEARVAGLSREAREVACALSLAPGQSVTAEELAHLAPEGAGARVLAITDELLRAHVIRTSGDGLGLSQEGWTRGLQKGLSEEARGKLHLRLAILFEQRKNEAFRQGKHLLRAGEVTRGLDVLAAHSELSQEETGKDPLVFFKYVQSLPPDWSETFDEAIRLCDEMGRPKRDAYALRSRLCGVLGLASQRDVTHSPALMKELAEYTGLSAFYATDPSLDAQTRMRAALQIAQQQYARSAERDRVVEPRLAMTKLIRAAIQTAGVITCGLDMPFLRSLPSLLPFSPLSPAFEVVQMLFDGMVSRCTARFEEASQRYTKLMARLAAPDAGGLDPSHNGYMRLGVASGVGMLEAGMGLESSLSWAAELEPTPKSRVNAVQIRMLYQLWQGNVGEANRLRQQVELLRIQDSPRQLFEGTHLLWQITAHGLSEDLTHLKQTMDEVTVLSNRHAGWKPVYHYGAGEYHRAGGAHEAALAEFHCGLALASAGEHQIWPYLAGAHLRTLDELGRLDEALRAGEEYVRAAESAGLGYVTSYVVMPLAVAHAKLGHKEAARAAADRVLASFVSLGTRGLNLGLAYETCARVALLLADRQEYMKNLGLCRDLYTSHGNAALVTKFEKLRRTATSRKTVGQPARGGAGFFTTANAGTSRLDLCAGPESRASCALAMVMDQCGAAAGVLYLVGAHGPFAAASSGRTDEALSTLALDYLMNEATEMETTGDGSSMTTGESQMDWTGAQGEKYHPVLLTHESADGFLVTGVVVVATQPDVPFSYPSRVANEVSRHLRRMGDATGIVVAG